MFISDEYKPNFVDKDEVINSDVFSDKEELLFTLGLQEYGQILNEKLITRSDSNIIKDNVLVNDWTSIKYRYLPHKNVNELQSKLSLIRQLNNELRFDLKLKPFDHKLNNTELSKLIYGVKIYGEHNWTKISRKLLPNWPAAELRKAYFNQIIPLKEIVLKNTKKNNDIQYFNPQIITDKNNSDKAEMIYGNCDVILNSNDNRGNVGDLHGLNESNIQELFGQFTEYVYMHLYMVSVVKRIDVCLFIIIQGILQ